MALQIPANLIPAIQAYQAQHPGWTEERILTAALSLFLMQNGGSDRQINRLYLDALFDYEES